MKKRIVLVVAIAALMATSVYAQTTDFFELVRTGTPQDVQAAIEKGADVNAYASGMTPLIIAARLNKDPEVITSLLKAGATLEAKDLQYGATALIWASHDNSNVEMIATLLKAGADVKARAFHDRTALMWAAANNVNPEVIMTLLKAGADPKVKDEIGLTAFDYAFGNNKLKGTDALKMLEEASK